MAQTITAPVVPAPQAGQQNVQQYVQAEVGNVLPDVVGVTTTSGGSVKVTVEAPDGQQASVFVTATLTAYTTAGVFEFIPASAGLYHITVKDVTSGNTVTTTIEVFQSEGV